MIKHGYLNKLLKSKELLNMGMVLKYENKADYVKATQKFYSSDETLVSGPLKGRELLRILRKIKPKDKKILDVGCGFGALIEEVMLIYPRNEFIGVDINKQIVSEAKKRVKKADFKVRDLENLKFKSNSFDVVFCTDTLEHAYNFEKAIKELSRVLKKDGHLIISIPNYFNITGIAKTIMEEGGIYAESSFNGFRTTPVEHENFVTSLKIRKLLKNNKLKIKHYEGIELLGGIIPFAGLFYTWYLIGKKFKDNSFGRIFFFAIGDLAEVIFTAVDLFSRYFYPFKLIALHNIYICKKK